MANLQVGIVGLPNVGKSTLFNLLTKSQVAAQNYPFCTIDPNVGIVRVKDERLDRIAAIVKPKQIIPAVVEFVDIAGLVAGAHKGEGLGNQFLANIREVSLIVEVVRDFDNPNITHVSNKVDPVSDIETIEMELIFKDIDTVIGAINKQNKASRTDEKEKKWLDILIELKTHLEAQKLAMRFDWNKDFPARRKALSLLTDKKIIYLINTNRAVSPELSNYLKGREYLSIDLKLEEELLSLSEEERKEYILELGVNSIDLERLIQIAYEYLGLTSFFTAGEKEVRAWTIYKGDDASEAAGVIHSDFEEKFIAADVVNYEDFMYYKGWEGTREAGKVRLEGREYIVQNGDIIIFKHGS